MSISKYISLGNTKKENHHIYRELSLFPELGIEETERDSGTAHDDETEEYDFTDLFARLAESDFRSRFHLKAKDREYIAEKGLIPSVDMPPTLWRSVWLLLSYPTTENRHQCEVILCSWRNMRRGGAAESGIQTHRNRRDCHSAHHENGRLG
jgi:hypothetical protein